MCLLGKIKNTGFFYWRKFIFGKIIDPSCQSRSVPLGNCTMGGSISLQFDGKGCSGVMPQQRRLLVIRHRRYFQLFKKRESFVAWRPRRRRNEELKSVRPLVVQLPIIIVDTLWLLRRVLVVS